MARRTDSPWQKTSLAESCVKGIVTRPVVAINEEGRKVVLSAGCQYEVSCQYRHQIPELAKAYCLREYFAQEEPKRYVIRAKIHNQDQEETQ